MSKSQAPYALEYQHPDVELVRAVPEAREGASRHE